MDRLLRSSQTHRAGKDHPTNQGRLAEGAIVDLIDAEHVSGYKLTLRFSDGTERIIDFKPFLRESRNPMIRAYLSPDRFRRFSIEHGDLIWNDYDLCFPIADLYEGNN